MHTITVHGRYEVDPGATVDFWNKSAFELEPSKKSACTLINDGAVNVSFTLDNGGGFIARTDSIPGFYDIVNRADGTMSVSATGANSSANGIVFFASGNLINDGRISVSSSQSDSLGVGAYASSVSMDNSGDFIVQAGGAALGVEADDVMDIQNSGSFSVSGGVQSTGWLLQQGGSVENDGTLNVDSKSGDAVGLLVLSAATIENSGSIIARADGGDGDSYGMQLGFGLLETIHVINSGLIRADHAIEEESFGGARNGITMVTNTGKIFGSISLGDYADQIDNAGKIVGDVDLGRGRDVYQGEGKGHVDGLIFGGGGADTLIGGRSQDSMHGDSGADDAKEKADHLHGGGGDDLLWGDGGDDTLIGGAGGDTLTGGAGDDVFVYHSIGNSSGSAIDLIADLGDNDRIDLSAIDANIGAAGFQHFSLVSAFDGHAGELVLSYDAASDTTLLQGDVDGDGKADLTIDISGDHVGFTGLVL